MHQKNIVILPQTEFGTNPSFINSQSIPNPQFGQNGPFGSFQPLGNFGTSANFLPFFQNNIGQAVPGQSPAPQPTPVRVKEVRVPQPYPVYVSKPVPIQVQVRVPVEVPKPYPVKVPHPVPVPVKVNVPYLVEKPYPVTITRTVVVPIDKPVYIQVLGTIGEPVAHPYSIGFPDERTSQFTQFNLTQFGGILQDYFADSKSSARITQQGQVNEQQSSHLSSDGQIVDRSSEAKLGIPQATTSLVTELDQINDPAGISQKKLVDEQQSSLSLDGQINKESVESSSQQTLDIPSSTSSDPEQDQINEIPVKAESSSKPTDYAIYFVQSKET